MAARGAPRLIALQIGRSERGAGDVGWYWHLVEAALRAQGHVTVAPEYRRRMAYQILTRCSGGRYSASEALG